MKLMDWQKRRIQWFYPKPGEADAIIGLIEGMDEDQPSIERGVYPR